MTRPMVSTIAVSTHSRPKAAGFLVKKLLDKLKCFNTQPPEGGWSALVRATEESLQFQHTAARRRLGHRSRAIYRPTPSFNTQPPEGGWANYTAAKTKAEEFQHTAARRRLAWNALRCKTAHNRFNTQPPEGGWVDATCACIAADGVSTHSRPKAAGHENGSLANLS